MKHIQQYEKEIPELKQQGLIRREATEKLGFIHKQVRKFIERDHQKQRILLKTKLTPFELRSQFYL